MALFFWLIIVLFILTAIYFVVFFSLVYYWHETKTSFIIVPLIYTFEFFVIGFLIVSIISLVFQFIVPQSGNINFGLPF